MFPDKNILSALTGKPFTRCKYETITKYNSNLNDIFNSIKSKENEFIKCSNIFELKKVLSKCLKPFNIIVSAKTSENSTDPYWVEGEYDVITEKMRIIFCASESQGTDISINSDEVKILSYYIPCIIAHECGHIVQHYRSKFEDFLWTKTPQFEFSGYVYEMDYLLEDIEMEAFSIQMLVEYKSFGALLTYRRYLSLFRSIRKKAKTTSDISTLNKTINKMNKYTEKYAKYLGYASISRLKFRIR